MVVWFISDQSLIKVYDKIELYANPLLESFRLPPSAMWQIQAVPGQTSSKEKETHICFWVVVFIGFIWWLTLVFNHLVLLIMQVCNTPEIAKPIASIHRIVTLNPPTTVEIHDKSMNF